MEVTDKTKKTRRKEKKKTSTAPKKKVTFSDVESSDDEAKLVTLPPSDGDHLSQNKHSNGKQSPRLNEPLVKNEAQKVDSRSSKKVKARKKSRKPLVKKKPIVRFSDVSSSEGENENAPSRSSFSLSSSDKRKSSSPLDTGKTFSSLSRKTHEPGDRDDSVFEWEAEEVPKTQFSLDADCDDKRYVEEASSAEDDRLSNRNTSNNSLERLNGDQDSPLVCTRKWRKRISSSENESGRDDDEEEGKNGEVDFDGSSIDEPGSLLDFIVPDSEVNSSSSFEDEVDGDISRIAEEELRQLKIERKSFKKNRRASRESTEKGTEATPPVWSSDDEDQPLGNQCESAVISSRRKKFEMTPSSSEEATEKEPPKCKSKETINSEKGSSTSKIDPPCSKNIPRHSSFDSDSDSFHINPVKEVLPFSLPSFKASDQEFDPPTSFGVPRLPFNLLHSTPNDSLKKIKAIPKSQTPARNLGSNYRQPISISSDSEDDDDAENRLPVRKDSPKCSVAEDSDSELQQNLPTPVFPRIRPKSLEDFTNLTPRTKFRDSPPKTSLVSRVKPVKAMLDSLSFLASLSNSVPEGKRRHPQAERFVTNFKKLKKELAQTLFEHFNNTVFDNKLPTDLAIDWNKRLLKTAGYCKYKRLTSATGAVTYKSFIELSEKILDSAERTRDTLLHELCHAAVWTCHGLNEGHGKFWKFYAKKATFVHRDIPLVTRCHSYTIVTKFLYVCQGCGYTIGRHSKSLDTKGKVCGKCHGTFQCRLNSEFGTPARGSQSSGGSRRSTGFRTPASTPITPRTPNKFAVFVKENYGSMKKERSDLKHGDIMKLLGKEFGEKMKV